MAVPKSERGITKLEFFDKANRLYDSIVQLLLHDFGMRKGNRDLRTFTYRAKMNAEDMTTFVQLCEKYHIDTENEYPAYLIEHYKEKVLQCAEDVISQITLANSVYVDVKSPNAMNEFSLRRNAQWKAIAACESLLQTFQAIIRNFPANASTFIPYAEQVVKEVEHLKNWKKSDNRLLKQIEENRQQ